ncbi:hypothetical protein G3578_19265 [Brevibacillus sp. SYP-B805]|jgi:hypothetical protein|uniref:hypothetical protein n=1 Tax=Brevibacillus sp. SYP-B805 TaxID=1578199 RepID=UPI0013EC94EC|nr:hypothetical protein [Brevibacillus sp. SYP-B805]NGQ97282.1 hypothetical protein [Brevibacillus sp. SYP-B805]
MKPIRQLNRYYKENPGFQQWIQANERWLRENPRVFRQLLRNPNMLNLFMDLMVLNSSKIERKLKRWERKK